MLEGSPSLLDLFPESLDSAACTAISKGCPPRRCLSLHASMSAAWHPPWKENAPSLVAHRKIPGVLNSSWFVGCLPSAETNHHFVGRDGLLDDWWVRKKHVFNIVYFQTSFRTVISRYMGREAFSHALLRFQRIGIFCHGIYQHQVDTNAL